MVISGVARPQVGWPVADFHPFGHPFGHPTPYAYDWHLYDFHHSGFLVIDALADAAHSDAHADAHADVLADAAHADAAP
jgi:hypothetical protein